MRDWLRESNLADIEPFIKYYDDDIDLAKDDVNIPGTSMIYVLNKALKMKKRYDPDLYAPGTTSVWFR